MMDCAHAIEEKLRRKIGKFNDGRIDGTMRMRPTHEEGCFSFVAEDRARMLLVG